MSELIDLLIEHDDLMHKIDKNIRDCASIADREDKKVFVMRQLKIWLDMFDHHEEYMVNEGKDGRPNGRPGEIQLGLDLP